MTSYYVSSSMALGKQCVVTSSSSMASLWYLHKQIQRYLRQGSLMGVLEWVEILPDGAVESQKHFFSRSEEL